MNLLVFGLRFTSQAGKFLKRAEKGLYERIYEKLEKLAIDPYPSDSKRVVGRQEKVFRVRIGKYRITYVVFYEQNEILIVGIDIRERIYG